MKGDVYNEFILFKFRVYLVPELGISKFSLNPYFRNTKDLQFVIPKGTTKTFPVKGSTLLGTNVRVKIESPAIFTRRIEVKIPKRVEYKKLKNQVSSLNYRITQVLIKLSSTLFLYNYQSSIGGTSSNSMADFYIVTTKFKKSSFKKIESVILENSDVSPGSKVFKISECKFGIEVIAGLTRKFFLINFSQNLDKLESTAEYNFNEKSSKSLLLSNPFNIDQFTQFEEHVLQKNYFYHMNRFEFEKTGIPIVSMVKLSENPLTFTKVKYLNTNTDFIYEFNLNEVAKMFMEKYDL